MATYLNWLAGLTHSFYYWYLCSFFSLQHPWWWLPPPTQHPAAIRSPSCLRLAIRRPIPTQRWPPIRHRPLGEFLTRNYSSKSYNVNFSFSAMSPFKCPCLISLMTTNKCRCPCPCRGKLPELFKNPNQILIFASVFSVSRMQTHGVAYPPHPGAGASDMNPPTYDMAISNPGPSVMPSGYEKQSAYNPNFAQ